MVDLFLSKQDILFDRLKHLGTFSSVTVREYGLDIYYTRADRTVRQWAEEGRIRRLDAEECLSRGLWKSGSQRLAWYEIQ